VLALTSEDLCAFPISLFAILSHHKSDVMVRNQMAHHHVEYKKGIVMVW
jgi:hypothetical protein